MYKIKRTNGKVLLSKQGYNITPTRSQKVWNHSPDGFECGYGGSGPAQLALAILLDYFNNSEIALKHYQSFKRECIASFSLREGEEHTVFEHNIKAILS